MCKFIVVTNRKLCRGDFLERIQLLCEAGVDRIVLREKDLSEWDYQKLAKNVLEICYQYEIECILHQYVYSAMKLHAAGIHLSMSDAMKYKETIQAVPVVGISVHSLEQIYLASACHADYVFYGHVFQTDCKPGLEPRGIPKLEEACEHSLLPVYAIGGISLFNVQSALNAGAAGVCVMSYGMSAPEEDLIKMIDICHEYQRFPSIITREIYEKLEKKKVEKRKEKDC